MYRILLYTFLDREDSLVDQALAVAIGGAPVRLYPDLCVQGRNLLIWKILWVFRCELEIWLHSVHHIKHCFGLSGEGRLSLMSLTAQFSSKRNWPPGSLLLGSFSQPLPPFDHLQSTGKL